MDDYYESKVCKIQNDQRKLWSTVNNLTGRGRRKHIVNEIVIDNVSVIGKDLDEMNRNFVSTGVYTGQNLGADSIISTGQIDSIMLTPTSSAETQTVIMALENNAIAAEDEI